MVCTPTQAPLFATLRLLRNSVEVMLFSRTVIADSRTGNYKYS